jgi:hypothetical protein
MINSTDSYVAWALLVDELDEAREHLQSLINQMATSGAIEDEEFAVELGHVYAHLNRAWHVRSQDGEISTEQWAKFSAFPKDLEPVG